MKLNKKIKKLAKKLNKKLKNTIYESNKKILTESELWNLIAEEYEFYIFTDEIGKPVVKAYVFSSKTIVSPKTIYIEAKSMSLHHVLYKAAVKLFKWEKDDNEN